MTHRHWGYRLQRLLTESQMTQSDLARKIWKEERPDNRGYTHVVGKDRIRTYVNHGTVPEKWVIEAIAKIFRTTPEIVCPEAYATEVKIGGGKASPKVVEPLMKIEAVAGSDLVLLRINQILDAVLAAEIFQLLSKANKPEQA